MLVDMTRVCSHHKLAGQGSCPLGYDLLLRDARPGLRQLVQCGEHSEWMPTGLGGPGPCMAERRAETPEDDLGLLATRHLIEILDVGGEA